jgi:hypothetical protein
MLGVAGAAAVAGDQELAARPHGALDGVGDGANRGTQLFVACRPLQAGDGAIEVERDRIFVQISIPVQISHTPIRF